MPTSWRSISYGWWLLAAAVLAQAVLTGVSFWSFGLYIQPLEGEFGWSRAQVSLGFSIALLISGLIAPFVGKAVDVYGPRRVIIIGAASSAASYLLLTTTSALWEWYVFQSINAVFRQMIFFIPFTALIAIWFDRRRGAAIGILTTGFALGGAVLVPIMRVIIDAVDWDGSFLVSAALVGAIFLPLGLLIRNRPADTRSAVDGGPRSAAASTASSPPASLTLGQALRTPIFWLIAFAIAMLFYGLFGWTVHAIPYYESVGISPGWAAALFSIASGGSMLTRLAFGFLADRLGNIEAAGAGLTACLVLAMLVLFATGGSTLGVALFLPLFMIGAGGGPLLELLLLTRAFGVANFGTILGAVAVVETIGLVMSPTAAGAIFDATGEYDWALMMLAGAFGASSVLFWVAGRRRRPILAEPPLAPDG